MAEFESAATPETADDEVSAAELEFAGSDADEGFSGASAGSALPDAASASAKLEAAGDELAVAAGAIAGRVAFGLASMATSIGVPRDAMQASCQCKDVKSLKKSGDRLLPFQRVTSRLFGSGENAEMTRAGQEARAAGLNTAKSAVPAVPSLEQIGGVELPLLAPRLFDLINATLTGAKAFKNFTLAKSLLVGHGGFPANAFKAENVFSKVRPELLDLLTN